MAKRKKYAGVKVSEKGMASALTEMLEIYGEEVTEEVNRLSAEAVKKLVKITRSTAPVGATGRFYEAIAWKILRERKWGNIYVWYVKKPLHRITHLLVHGHATRNGGRVPGDPFLHNALEEVLPEYEEAVKEAIKND